MHPVTLRRVSARIGSTIRVGILLLAALLFASVPAYAGFDSDCRGLKLKGAGGVPQDKVHEYSFIGTCKIIFVHSGGDIDVLATVPAEAKGIWDRSNLQFSEKFRVLANAHYGGADEGDTHWNGGDISDGLVQTVFKCNDDPLITSASCLATTHSNQSGFEQFSNPANQNRPLLKGKTTLAEAEGLSKQNAGNQPGQPVQPPPPKLNATPKKAVDTTDAIKAIEAQTAATAKAGAKSNTGAQVAPIPGGVKLPPAGLPDLTSGPQVRVAGKYQVNWGQTIAVSSLEARRVHDGLCDFAVEHELRNLGTGTASGFSRRWFNHQAKLSFTDSYPAVPAGGTVSRTDTLSLRPGMNQLSLDLDNLGQVTEANENNNSFHVVIQVTGTCAGK